MERIHIGYINAQIMGMRHYKRKNEIHINDTVSFSRINSRAMENRKFDDNCIVVVNTDGESIGGVAKDFASYLAPLIRN